MFVFLGYIPPNTTHQDILNFVEPALSGKTKRFSNNGVLEEIKIIGLYDDLADSVEYHGLLIITPDRAALQVIKLLNNRQLLGKPIVVREYRVRSIQNDPRLKSLHKAMVLKERRTASRRRTNLKVIKNSSYRPDMDFVCEKIEPTK